MTARLWKPGDKALVEVEVTWTDESTVQCSIAADDGYFLPINALRPLPAAGEAATEDVIERVTDVIDREGYWPKPDEGVQEYADRIARALAAASLLAPPVREPEAGTLRIEGHWLVREVNEHTCGTGPGGHYGAHEPGCGLIPEVDLSTLPDWRSEAEVKAEALREAAAALRLAKEPGHRYLLDLLDADVAASPDVWLERRADRLAKEVDQ